MTRRLTAGYVLILSAAFTVSLAAGWTGLAGRMNQDAYDWLFRIHAQPASPPRSVVLAFDEQTLSATGGMPRLRSTLADALERVRAAQPAVVVVDILLAEPGADPAADNRLADVFSRTPNLVLASGIIPNADRWDEPLPLFRPFAKAVGHVHAAPDPISRVLPLELVAGRERRWAMALEAARLASGGAPVIESPSDLEVGGAVIPAKRDTARAMYIRYRSGIPVIPAARIDDVEQFRGKAVFVGITAQTAALDRLVTPLDDRMMSGVEIHAQAFETIMGRAFLKPAPVSFVVLLALLLTVAAGAVFASLTGVAAYAVAALVLMAGHAAPHVAFANGLIIPYLTPVWAAWLSAVSAASWQYFVVRRQLRKSESDKVRYQQAIHFVTHEMRSPLTAIQGSSELMGRYNLSEEKRKQMAGMINSESKRLAKMIQTFLDIERLTDGKMEIRSEPFDIRETVQACGERARPLAERKQIALQFEEIATATLRGDRELLEYAVYNLLTNAIKYSPAETTVTVGVKSEGGELRLAVRDQGIGMDEKEIRKLGTKFYRTKRAEASGEVGTGIGLSLVQQIVAHHNGRVEVVSAPGKGSCFTMVLPVVQTVSLGK